MQAYMLIIKNMANTLGWASNKDIKWVLKNIWKTQIVNKPGEKWAKWIEQVQETSKFTQILADVKETFQDRTNVIILAGAVLFWAGSVGTIWYFKSQQISKKPEVEEVQPTRERVRKITQETPMQKTETQNETPTPPENTQKTTPENESYNRMQEEIAQTGELTLGTSPKDIQNLPKIIEMMNAQDKVQKRK